jgi:hypothetical protein
MRSRVVAAISGLSLSARGGGLGHAGKFGDIRHLQIVRRLRGAAAGSGHSAPGSDDRRFQSSGVIGRGVSTGDTGSCPERYTRAGWLQFMLAWGRLRWCSPEACKQWRIVGEMPHEGGC